MMLGTRRPSIVQKLRQSRVRPSEPGSPLTTARSVRRANLRSGLLIESVPSVPLARWKKVGSTSGKSRGLASAASSTASSSAFDCELKSMSRNTLPGAARVSSSTSFA